MSIVWVTSCGPMTPANISPAMTRERARRSAGAQSAAAKRKVAVTAM